MFRFAERETFTGSVSLPGVGRFELFFGQVETLVWPARGARS
jgi:hypothetical protein